MIESLSIYEKWEMAGLAFGAAFVLVGIFMVAWG